MPNPWEIDPNLLSALNEARRLDELTRYTSSGLAKQFWAESQSFAAAAAGLQSTFESIRASTQDPYSRAIRESLDDFLPTAQLFARAHSTAALTESAWQSLMAVTDAFRSSGAGASVPNFRGTFNALTAAGEIARLSLTMPAVRANALAAGSDLASHYLASARAVQALELSVVRAGAELAAMHKGTSPLLPGVSIEWAKSVQEAVSQLSSAARLSVDEAYGSKYEILGRAPAIEIYTAAHLASALTLDPDAAPAPDSHAESVLDEQDDAFEAKLQALDPRLVELFRGAVNAVERAGPDWQRHAMTSFRELLTQVMHQLAPDDAILSLAGPDDLHHGRPTRSFRLKTLFMVVAGPNLTAFLQADMKSTIQLFDALNGETHKLGTTITVPQVRYLQARVVGAVGLMLDAAAWARASKDKGSTR